MNNIYILNKNYKKIGTLSNQGANPQAPYYEDLFIQELETGADTYQFSTMSTPYTQDLLEIGNHIMFTYKNRNELFTITSLEYSHNEGYKTIGVYAEGIGFDLLEIYMKRPENEKENSSGGSSSGGSNSGSGGSSSGGGRDEDNDGDDNTDDEYADVDDVYVDENGIIIYDKYGQDDYADPDNVSVDENGIIIYRRNKRNRKKDSLEFKNISYSRFLSILLKNTGWSYVCQPGLESIKHDITVRYDTNIFALLQDSMQSYRGVELEFVHELVGGRVQKVIKAYKDGGRGSFVGKRFEYGTNVRGITKTQEVANSEDDTILYVDNVGINVRYDVDFALKSAEVPEIEIGDTHYVIDRDFYPPMTIKARIGKIEISFSDPTVNKIYLANNKRISGSAVEDELDEDDIKGIIDDYDNNDDNGAVYDHYHDRIMSGKRTLVVKSDDYDYNEGLYYIPNSDSGYEYQVFHAGCSFYPAVDGLLHLGDPDHRFYAFFSAYIDCDMISVQNVECSNVVRTPVVNVSEKIIFPDGSELTSASGVPGSGTSKLISTEEIRVEREDGSAGQLDVFGKLYVTEEIKCELTTETNTLKVNTIEFSDGTTLTTANGSGGGSDPGTGGGTITDGFDIVRGNELFVNRIDAKAIEVAQLEVNKLLAKNIVATSISEMTTADIGAIKVGTIKVDVTAIVKKIEEVESIEFADGSTLTTANGLGGGGTPSNPGTGSYPNIFDPDAPREDIYVGHVTARAFEAIEGQFGLLVANQITGWNNDQDNPIEVFSDIKMPNRTLEVKDIKFADGTTMTTANGSGGGSNTFDTIRVDYIWCANEDTGAIHMQDDLILHNSLQLHGDLEVEDGIVYANEVRALKFTDLSGNPINSVSALSDLSEYATVEALQEEIRAKDEQIASLETRLAKIEAMLDINND